MRGRSNPVARGGWFLLLALVLLVSLSQKISAEAPIRLSWSLQHAVVSAGQEPQFERRGYVTLTVPQDSVTAALEIENEDVSVAKVSEQLLDVNTPKLYQLRLISDTSDRYVLTTVPACQVLRANFR